MRTRTAPKAETVATFGVGQLVKTANGLELRGGTENDRTEAKEWVSLFMPEAVIRDQCKHRF